MKTITPSIVARETCLPVNVAAAKLRLLASGGYLSFLGRNSDNEPVYGPTDKGREVASLISGKHPDQVEHPDEDDDDDDDD